MKICCKDCEDVETFDGSEDAKDSGWHKVGAVWICDTCWESDYADSENEDENEDELELDDDEEEELDEEEDNNLIFFPGTKGNMHFQRG